MKHSNKKTIDNMKIYRLQSHLLRSGKISPNQENGLGNRGQLKVLNDTKLILKGYLWGPLKLIQDQFGIIQNLQSSPIPQTIFLVGIFFATSHSKMALIFSAIRVVCNLSAKRNRQASPIWVYLGRVDCIIQQAYCKCLKTYFLLD